MILSERELEIGDDHTGILVLAAGEPGQPLIDVLPLQDLVIELETTPNRPDLLSVYGVAREVAALWELELAPPPGREPERTADEPVDVKVEDAERCPRYIGRTFRDVGVGVSPPWMKARLTAAGMRPISNVVDITNYVMLALGIPLHAFDRAKLAEGRIVVRRARKKEQIRTLDGTLRELDPWDLVIADAKDAVAIAGVMGSAESEVDDGTSELLLEAANFEPFGILKTSERLGLRSEASARWEKGLDPYLAEQAAVFATELLVEHAGGSWTGHTDVRDDLPERPVIRFRPQRADVLNGLEVPPEEQRSILERLQFEVADDWTVMVPTWRARDVTREVDLVEEVARAVLDSVPFTLRLAPSLVEAVRRNLDVGNEGIALFEIAHVYLLGPTERWHAAAIAEGGFFRIKGVVETLRATLGVEPSLEPAEMDLLRAGRAARIGAGWLGELHPTLLEGTWCAFELDLEQLFAAVPETRVYEDVITYPAVRQDLAFIVPEDVAAGDVVQAARAAAGPELREIRVFDVYRGPQVGEGRKSLAFAVSFQSADRTLSDEDAAVIRGRIASALEELFGAELRTG